MMRTIIMCAALALTITAAGAAEKDTDSANYILPGCKQLLTKEDARGYTYSKTGQEVFDAGFCSGHVHAAVAVRAVLDDQRGCTVIPRSVTYNQVVRVVVGYIEARPQRMHEPFTYLLMEALQDAWPCKPSAASQPSSGEVIR
jgi:hypothetical protein